MLRVLPAELVDHIFSILRDDIPAIRACSKAHPFFLRIAERHLYTDIMVETDNNSAISELSKQLCTNSHILHYPRTFEIHVYYFHDHSRVKREALSIIRMLPRMANLTSLRLFSLSYGQLSKDRSFLSAFGHCVKHSSIKQLCLGSLSNFPFSVLDNGKSIKELTLSACSAKKERTPRTKSLHLSLEKLILHDVRIQVWPEVPDLFFWAARRVTNLTSLQLSDAEEPPRWTGVSDLLTACSNSLQRLHIGYPGFLYHTSYTFSTAPDYGSHWLNEHTNYPFTLASHKHLKQLSLWIFVRVRDYCADDAIISFQCPLHAIIRLAKTAPSIQDLVLRIDWDLEDSDVYSMGRFDWSPLALLYSDSAANCPRIQIFIGSENAGRPISPPSILDSLLENETLRDLVGRDLVVLTPEIGCEKPWELTDFLSL